MMERFVSQDLSGWGRFPVERCRVFRPEKRAAVAEILSSRVAPSYIARGLGRSYGDAALNREGGVVSQLRLNRFLSFDALTGELECEAGVSFAEIIECFLPRGFFPAVTPGTKFVTVGGALAHNIHGKNHHRDGSIGNSVSELTLLTPRGETLRCSPHENSEVFWATVGGAGLTGVILSARFKLRPVETAYVAVDYDKAQHIDGALELFSSAADRHYKYSVAWIDCLARGRSLGRTVLMRGDHAPLASLPASRRAAPLALPAKAGLSFPCDLPSSTLNHFTVGLFNALFYGVQREARGRLVPFEKFFYPLDRLHHWNRLYGRRGFVQYQAVFPRETSRAGLIALLEELSRSGHASFLAVLKRFGKGDAGLLSFPLEGYTLALDLPAWDGLTALIARLDELVLRHAGRVYLAKDALLAPAAFAAMYPQLDRFRAVKRRLDPENVLSSSLSRRLGLTPAAG